MANRTGNGLADFAISLVGRAYMYGVNGLIITEALIQAKARQYPSRYTAAYIEKCRLNIGKVGYDCSSIADLYTGTDKSANGWLALAQVAGGLTADQNKGKTWGLIGTIPEIRGLMVHSDGHTGIYIGGGYVVEARGVDYGVVKTRLSARPWTRWAKCPLVSYTEEVTDMIERGDKDENVRALQRALLALDYDLGEFVDENGQPTGADGSYGGRVAAAVLDFKSKNGLGTNGDIVDLATMAALFRALAARPAGSGITQAQLDAANKAAADAADLAQQAAQQAQASQAAADKATARLAEIGEAITVLRAAGA